MAAFLANSCLAQDKPKFPSRVSGISAKLYYDESGTFSKDILADPNFALWNTIIGEGSAGSPSHSVLIEVESTGDGRPSVVHNEVLTITTQISGRPPVVHRFSTLAFSANGKNYEGVLINDTGCVPVTISAYVDRQQAVKKKIDFECGE
jgi:hypothetical protein